jgi:hypothetical protein
MKWLLACAATAAAATAAPLPAAADDLAFGERLEPFAVLGLRYQVDAEDPSRDEQVHRGLIRAAAGLRFRAAETLSATVRLRAAAAGADPRLSYVDLGGPLDPLAVAIDRAYLQLAPLAGLELAAGLVDHPAQSSRALWDPDLAPAGVAARYERRLRQVPLFVRPAAFAYLLRSDLDGRPAGLFGGQLAATVALADVDVTAAGAAYLFEDESALALRAAGNRLDPGGELAQEFAIIEARGAARLHLLALPIEIAGTALINAAADEEGFGWTAGVAVGVREWPGDVRLGYEYRDLEADAVLAALPADDHRLATNYRSHELEVSYQVAEEVTARVTGFVFRHRDGDDPATAPDEGQRQGVIKIDLVAEL